MNSETKRQRLLKFFLIACIVSTAIHFTDYYFYGAMSEFSLKMHLFILTDGLAGGAILGFTFWSSLILREQLNNSHTS